MDPISYLTADGIIVGAFVYPGQVASNPGGPYGASGVLSINSDWVITNGQNWTITISNGTKQVILFPSQFEAQGSMLNAWIGYDSTVLDWSVFTVTVVRGNASLALVKKFSGVGGSFGTNLGTVDFNSADFATLPLMIQAIQGPADKKKSNTVGTIVGIIVAIIVVFALYRLYKMVRG